MPDEVVDLLPEEPFRHWVAGRLDGSGPFEVTRITTGMSHELLRVGRGGRTWVVRRPPQVAHSAVSARSLSREFRVLLAIHGSDVPHPCPLLLCEDPEVIGVPFMVVEDIDGVRLYDGLPPTYDSPTSKRQLSDSLIDALAALHLFSWESSGLADLGHPDKFTERQVDRWLSQLQSYQLREFPGLESTARWLREHVPPMQRVSLIHGDYGLHNVLFPKQLGPVLAVLDWETATIGDPMMDLGYFLSMWLDPEESQRWHASSLPYDVGGFPSRSELAERYEMATGVDTAHLPWYCAVAQIKMAAMLEGNYSRHLQHGEKSSVLAALAVDVPNHVDYANHLVQAQGADGSR